jgi:hypothetical protein
MSSSPRRTLADFDNHGYKALIGALERSEWGTPEQALASLAVFASPQTVQELRGQPIFPSVRYPSGNRSLRGRIDQDRRVIYDDNYTPTAAFKWATGFPGKTHLQFNHIYEDSDNAVLYTALQNLCVTPSFMAKLADNNPLLKFRAWKLFGDLSPEGEPSQEPPGYDSLTWASPLNPLPDLEGRMRRRMAHNREKRIASCVCELGWVFSGFRPDPDACACTAAPL